MQKDFIRFIWWCLKVNSPLPSVTKAIGYLRYFARTSTWEGHIKTSGPMLVPNPFSIIWLKTRGWDLTMWSGELVAMWPWPWWPGGCSHQGERDCTETFQAATGDNQLCQCQSDSNIAHNYHVQFCLRKQGMLTNPNWNVTNEEGCPSQVLGNSACWCKAVAMWPATGVTSTYRRSPVARPVEIRRHVETRG